ncbi:E3 ubiquitin-protein ligase RNF169 [Hemicordylus capensis]|uniref:E3 ubiquitin-protein ligase RNF169 n=1 Tax=Hemicordylus capensis TaxID=884348 RepID=UPI002303F731|nr:E3 ubiquitin-protein ligase RNF169 [Hemicordylus capensis]
MRWAWPEPGLFPSFPSRRDKMAAAAAAATARLGVRAAVSPLLRRGRGRRRQQQQQQSRSGAEEKEAVEPGVPEGGPCRCSCPQGPGRPLCRSRPDSLASAWPASGAGPPPPPPPPPPPSTQAERDFVFRAPITLSKPGELHEEYRSRLRKLKDEKLQEERTSEDFIHKLIIEDSEAGRRKIEDQKKEETLIVKMTPEHFPERLSDSENEEPFQGRSAHRSAFVSKGSIYSFALLAGNLTSKVERSQSCNDTLRDRSKSRQRSAPIRTKVNPLTSASTPLVGVLSSTQNNRCLSAPDLTADKRLIVSTTTSLSALQKPERSISPESNDSISEELNHFKPIVCSPCTPPKRLPDGRVLSPLIIKSTPRNLTRSLQKPTTYEASPRILKKWEQIFQERQIKKTLSKATLTSLAPEMGEDSLVPSVNSLNVVKEPRQTSSDLLPPDTITRTQAELDALPSICVVTRLEDSSTIKRDGEAAAVDGGLLVPVARSGKTPLNTRVPEVSSTKSALPLAGSCLSIDAKMVTRKVMRVNPVFPENSTLDPSVKVTGKKQLKYLNESELSNLPNGIGVERVLGEEPQPLRWGRKRQCKTKHLEPSSTAKRRRQAACQGRIAAANPLRSSELQQEEDRRLALQLQRKFDSENRTMARRKGRADQYFLRSKNILGAK